MIKTDFINSPTVNFLIGGYFLGGKMKRLFFILALVVCFAHGACAEELLALDDNLNAEFSVIEEKLKKISPALVVSVANLPEMDRLVQYKAYLVRRNFELFKSKYITEFVIMAAVKGRKIKTYENHRVVDVDPVIFEDYVFSDIPDGSYFLDNGEFDSKKCKKKNKKLGWYQACEFPEGYETVRLDIYANSVRFMHDDAQSNVTTIVTLHMSDTVDETNGEIKLMHYISKWDYREWLADQNRFNLYYMKYGGWTEEYKEKLKKRRPEYYEALKAQAIAEGTWDTPTSLGVEGGIQSVFYSGMEGEDAAAD